DRLVVAVLRNPEKKAAFTVEERMDMLRELTHGMPKVEIASFDGLLVDFVKRQGAHLIVRGVRAFSDFEYEFQMALMNRKLAPELETMFLMPKEKYSSVSSKLVREIGHFGGDLKELVPEPLRDRVAARLKQG
ncbi:MAG TPA: pantetheine-phosphate adenylyltransferase, partial [Holophagaceae bacterium]|nr:pantetheine-phosphate adenylyltransferase [Holophagaceae bacterium]